MKKRNKKIVILGSIVIAIAIVAAGIFFARGGKPSCSSSGQVCGYDGNTYESECKAWEAGITDTIPGECLKGPAAQCPLTFSPVCSTDGNQYKNECEAKRQGAEIAYAGPCFSKADVSGCKDGYGPVCGKDGKTYPSSCLTTKENILFVGNCEHKVGDWVGPNRCADVEGFVCGKDGMTYQNECLAKTFGTEMAGAGYCGHPLPPVTK